MLQQVAAWIDECEKKLAAGTKLRDIEQARLARAKRILRDAGVTTPDERGSPPPGQSFRDLLARHTDRRETASTHAVNAPVGRPTSGPPPRLVSRPDWRVRGPLVGWSGMDFYRRLADGRPRRDNGRQPSTTILNWRFVAGDRVKKLAPTTRFIWRASRRHLCHWALMG
jgi:hypothetical protein